MIFKELTFEIVFKSKSNIKTTDKSLIWNTDLVETLEFDNLLSQSIVAIVSALNREESRGAHSREAVSYTHLTLPTSDLV